MRDGVRVVCVIFRSKPVGSCTSETECRTMTTPVFCIQCGYSLTELRPVEGASRHGACPECGMAFDWFDAATFASRPNQGLWQRVGSALGWVGVFYPMLVAWLWYGTYGLAWFVLGRAPIPSRDDPKDIAGASILVAALGLACIGWPASIFCLGRGIWVWASTRSTRVLWARIALAVFVWAASIGMIYASRDPIGVWIMD